MKTKTKSKTKPAPKPIKAKKAILKNEFIEDFDLLIDQFMEESERAAVLLGVAKLDYLLGQLLGKHMVSSYTSDDPVLSGDGPLSTFSSRIYLSYRLGLLDANFAKALHLIRKTRNDFAHAFRDSKLNTPPHSDRIKELTLLFQQASLFDEVKKLYFSEMSGPSGNFFTALSILIMRLETIIIKVEPISPASAFGIRLS